MRYDTLLVLGPYFFFFCCNTHANSYGCSPQRRPLTCTQTSGDTHSNTLTFTHSFTEVSLAGLFFFFVALLFFSIFSSQYWLSASGVSCSFYPQQWTTQWVPVVVEPVSQSPQRTSVEFLECWMKVLHRPWWTHTNSTPLTLKQLQSQSQSQSHPHSHHKGHTTHAQYTVRNRKMYTYTAQCPFFVEGYSPTMFSQVKSIEGKSRLDSSNYAWTWRHTLQRFQRCFRYLFLLLHTSSI